MGIGTGMLAVLRLLYVFGVATIAATCLIAESAAAAEADQIYEQSGKCLKYLPNIGRMVEIPCASAKSDEPDQATTLPPKEESQSSGGEGVDIVLPARGSQLRTDLMNAARPTFEREIGGSILFQVRRIAVYGDWAFGNVHPTRSNGDEIDWKTTKFADDVKAGAFDSDASFFLLKRNGGSWNLVESAIGPTDVAWDSWRQQYKLPTTLFTP